MSNNNSESAENIYILSPVEEILEYSSKEKIKQHRKNMAKIGIKLPDDESIVGDKDLLKNQIIEKYSKYFDEYQYEKLFIQYKCVKIYQVLNAMLNPMGERLYIEDCITLQDSCDIFLRYTIFGHAHLKFYDNDHVHLIKQCAKNLNKSPMKSETQIFLFNNIEFNNFVFSMLEKHETEQDPGAQDLKENNHSINKQTSAVHRDTVNAKQALLFNTKIRQNGSSKKIQKQLDLIAYQLDYIKFTELIIGNYDELRTTNNHIFVQYMPNSGNHQEQLANNELRKLSDKWEHDVGLSIQRMLKELSEKTRKIYEANRVDLRSNFYSSAAVLADKFFRLLFIGKYTNKIKYINDAMPLLVVITNVCNELRLRNNRINGGKKSKESQSKSKAKWKKKHEERIKEEIQSIRKKKPSISTKELAEKIMYWEWNRCKKSRPYKYKIKNPNVNFSTYFTTKKQRRHNEGIFKIIRSVIQI